MERQWLAALVLTCLLPPRLIAAADALLGPQPAVTAERQEETSLLHVPDLFARHALNLEPTHPAFSLAFPLQVARRVFWDTSYVLTAPARWDGRDWLHAGLFGVGTAGTLALDREIDEESRLDHPRPGGEKTLEDAIENFGALPGGAIFGGGPLVLGLLTGNEDLARLGIDVGESVLIGDAILTESLKSIFGRSRPVADKGTLHLKPFSGSASMPSGHSATAFAIAGAIAEHYDNDLRIALPMYGLAGAVSVSRIRADAHFVSDVFVGSVIGVITARTIVHLEQARQLRNEQETASSVRITPWVGPDARGLQLRVRW